MKRLRLYIALTLALGVAGWLFWPEPAPLLPTTGSTIVIFGDSLAAGVGAAEGGDIASRLTTALGRPILNLGVPGDTTADGLARIEELLAADPQVVILLLGGNDALKQVPVEDIFANLTRIITRIQAVGAAVILVGEPGGLYGNRFEKEYERLARTYRTFYVPNILSGLIGRAEYMSDYIHPNDAGYQKATERILPVVQDALGV
ncbi:arylesterase [Candidatus Nomurabacteria bacterium]|nr:arylesterase [Candidatus Nomurabacteria bacterium]